MILILIHILFLCNSYEDLTSTMHASYCLFKEFVCKILSRPEDYYKHAIKAIISLFLSSASRLRHFVDNSNGLEEVYDQQISLTIKGFYVEISGLFIKCYYESFGSCGYHFVEGSSKSELKVII